MTKIAPSLVHESLGRWILASGMEVVADLDKSHGPYLHDAKSGKDYLDMFTFFGSRPLIYNHPRLTDPDFIEKLGKISVQKPSNCDIYTPEYAEFIDVFGREALNNEFAHIFVIEGGSPAVENSLKAAFDWKAHKNIEAGRGEKELRILHFKQCFHGRTGYSLSLTDSYDIRKTQYFPKFDWPRVSNPHMKFPFDEAAQKDVEEREALSLAEIALAFDKYPNEIAGMIIEPIQGEGGDNYFRSEFLAELRKIADEREALLIFDEVQTGFATTGSWWDWQNHGVQPDLMVFGKKTGVCGFAATSRIDEIDGVFKVSSRISSTFEGNLVDMVRTTRVIEVIKEENLLQNAKTMGAYSLQVLSDLENTFEQLSAVRGRGLWSAFDLPSQAERDQLLQAIFKEEMIALPSGTHSIRLRPTLDVSADALGRAAAQIDAALRRVY